MSHVESQNTKGKGPEGGLGWVVRGQGSGAQLSHLRHQGPHRAPCRPLCLERSSSPQRLMGLAHKP